MATRPRHLTKRPSLVACPSLTLPAPTRAQDAVNGVIETMQEFTADPRTDARLGKVGR